MHYKVKERGVGPMSISPLISDNLHGKKLVSKHKITFYSIKIIIP